MTNNENNLGMAGETGVNETPLSPDGSAGTAREDIQESTTETENEQEALTPEEFNELKAKAARADENWEKYVRLTADFDNYKKRAARERSEGMRYANEALIEKLLPVVDNFEAALGAMEGTDTSVDSVKTGVKMIYSQLKAFLTENGAEEIDAAGQEFDPNLHEAVGQEAAADLPEGQIVKQMRKGYKLRDRLIRPAMVVVAKQP